MCINSIVDAFRYLTLPPPASSIAQISLRNVQDILRREMSIHALLRRPSVADASDLLVEDGRVSTAGGAISLLTREGSVLIRQLARELLYIRPLHAVIERDQLQVFPTSALFWRRRSCNLIEDASCVANPDFPLRLIEQLSGCKPALVELVFHGAPSRFATQWRDIARAAFDDRHQPIGPLSSATFFSRA